MITKTALLRKTSVFLNDFSDAGNVWKCFNEEYQWETSDYETPTMPKHLKIIYADYTFEDYSGDAYVLGYDKQKKQFFEVHGGHCSCYGLEGQWEPEYYEDWKVLSACIEKRLAVQDDYYRRTQSSKELSEFLEVVK